ncbi:hypothetical protein EDD17DRAFT_1549454 [Pisolithus thermaeus]|nr:hypothetical protein EDD17DRAFT_1549454 [Pisolithus thermaeus]
MWWWSLHGNAAGISDIWGRDRFIAYALMCPALADLCWASFRVFRSRCWTESAMIWGSAPPPPPLQKKRHCIRADNGCSYSAFIFPVLAYALEGSVGFYDSVLYTLHLSHATLYPPLPAPPCELLSELGSPFS